jgi:hypothetical protein
MNGGSVTYVILEGLEFFIRHVPITDFTDVLGSAKQK